MYVGRRVIACTRRFTWKRLGCLVVLQRARSVCKNTVKHGKKTSRLPASEASLRSDVAYGRRPTPAGLAAPLMKGPHLACVQHAVSHRSLSGTENFWVSTNHVVHVGGIGFHPLWVALLSGAVSTLLRRKVLVLGPANPVQGGRGGTSCHLCGTEEKLPNGPVSVLPFLFPEPLHMVQLG